MLSKYRDEVAELFKTLTYKERVKKEIRLRFRLIPTPDGKYIKKVEEYNDIIIKIFELGDKQLPDELVHQIRMNHVDGSMRKAAEAVRSIKTKQSELEPDFDMEPF